ncbi:MAG: hypothetical protein HGGPFJEG_00002 [Ignavibacteria bacterium]|nr:hypothetical protein [Ignavibacteria bacterium]
MQTLPTGIVTFLFTDIEGSTKLSQDFPEELHASLDIHNAILNNAIETNEGYVFEMVGDAFCSAFDKPGNAINAAVQIQRELADQKWNQAEIKVRIGMHSGKVELINGKYSGYITLARTARVMSAAYGGQIIITEQVYDAALNENSFQKFNSKNSDERKITFLDLGERKLKDLIQPVKLYQIVTEGMQKNFPPLKTLDARPNNLPIQLNNFIGREKEKEEIKTNLSECSLLTLLGPGGTGKSRLSVQAGADLIDRFENGVWLAELASISDPQHIVTEVASVFKLSSDGKKESKELLKNYLREKELLLILDNCEHLIEECARFSEELLRTCSKLKILTSSREPLHISGEKILHVTSLSLPDKNEKLTLEKFSKYESVQLFIDRALAVDPDFRVNDDNAKAVMQLCHELEGIPLAIELAAARIKVMKVETIVERLNDRFKLLTGGKRTSLPRQQTLKALIDWSYDLLSDNEKIMLQRIAVFYGGWTLEAAEKICSFDPLDEYEILDLLSNLIDKSLIKISESSAELRYGMLETIRKYAEEKLDASPDKQILQTRHCEYFYEFVKNSESDLLGKNQRKRIKSIDSDYDNIREAVKFSLTHHPETALKFAVELGKYIELRSYFSEGHDYLKNALEVYKEDDLILKIKAKYWIGYFLTFLGNYKDSKILLEECLSLFRKENNIEGTVNTLLALTVITLFEQDFKTSTDYAVESLNLSRESGKKSLIAVSLRTLGVCNMNAVKLDEARKIFEEGMELYREIGDQVQLAKIIGNIGALEYYSGDYESALKFMEESLNHRIELGDRHGIALSYSNLGSTYSMLYQFDKSEESLYKSLEMLKEIGDKRLYATPLNTIGNIANEKKEYKKAMELFKESMNISHEVGEKFFLCKAIQGISVAYIGLDDYENGCLFSANYISMMLSTNAYLIPPEVARIEEVKTELKKNLSPEDYEKYWTKGEKMSIDEVVELINSTV